MSEGAPSYRQPRDEIRIAIDVTPLARPGADRGDGRYVRAVLLAAEREGFPVTQLCLRARRGRTQHVYDLFDRQRRLRRMDYEVFHATNPYMSAMGTRGRNVVSVLDLIPLELASYRQLGLNARLFLRSLVPRADRIVALSQFTASRIVEILGVPEDRLVVASLPPASTFQPQPRHAAQEWLARLGIRHPFIAAVADGRVHDPRKQAEWLPAIGQSLRRAGCQLVVAGAECQRFFRADDHVIALGRISDADLARLFGAARALVYTSAYEGQGLPPLEAMACGTPVVAMRNSAISEVVGAGGILIDENERGNGTPAAELAAACVTLVRDENERGRLSRLALTQSRAFTLSAFGTALACAYVE